MRSTLLILAASVATLGSAQFSSGFENWPDTVPSDWMGVKSSISADSVAQVSTNVHGGLYAARLTNTTTSHKRFTTQSVTVTNGTIYQISFWVRGTGEVRTGLFDGRSTGFGYAPYNAYVVSTGNTWTQVTQSITCQYDTTGAEFILSVRSTSGPEHLVVDDVNITGGGGPVNASIFEIQNTTDVNGNSPLNGQIVLTGGIVTGVDTIGQNSYFIQSGNGPWTGIYCFDATSVVAIGDSVVLQATVTEFNSLTELTAVTSITVVGQFATPAPQLLGTDGATQEQWEGVLAVIANAECTSLPDGFGEWTINQPSGNLPVDDLMYLYTPTVGTNYDVTGVVHYANGAWKIEPRNEDDVVLATGLSELGVLAASGLFPNPATDLVTIDLGAALGNVSYIVTDLTGRVVMNGSLINSRTGIQVDGLNAGLYSVTLRSDASVKAMSLLVVR
jgi:hypothetical protein